MFVLTVLTYAVVGVVFVIGMYLICLRVRRDRREIRMLLSPRVAPTPVATVVMIVAVPVHALEEGVEVAHADVVD